MEFNPWQVESIQEFLVLKCPECAFDSKEENTFQDHAINNHPLSFILFGNPIKEECFEDPIIIEEHKLESEEDWDYTNESDILFMPSITVERSSNKLGGSENYSNEVQVEPEESEEHILKEENINGNFVNENEDFDDIFTSSGEHPESMKNCDKTTLLENSKSNCEEEFRRKEKFSAIKSDENTEIQLQKIEKELNKDDHEGGHQNCENGKRYQDFRFQCSLCNKSYFYKQSLKKHNNSVHEGKKPYQCTICGTSFGAKKNLDNHNIQVHQKRELYQCSLCDKSYPYSHSLKIHIETVHEGKKPFQCTHCDSIFTQKSSLDAHIAAIHEKKKPYKCFICSLSFAKIGQWKVHERSKSHQNMIKRNKVQKIININAEKETENETITNPYPNKIFEYDLFKGTDEDWVRYEKMMEREAAKFDKETENSWYYQ